MNDNLLRVNDYVRKTRKGLVPSNPLDKRTFGIVLKTTSTKAYVIHKNTLPSSVKIIKGQMIIKVKLEDAKIFLMPKRISKFKYIDMENA